MQNKPNFQKAATNVTSIVIKPYINIPLRDSFKNKPNSKPIEPNFQNPKMSLTFYYTGDYGKKQRLWTAKNKAKLGNEYNLLLEKGLRKFMYITASKTNLIQTQSNPIAKTRNEYNLLYNKGLAKMKKKRRFTKADLFFKLTNIFV